MICEIIIVKNMRSIKVNKRLIDVRNRNIDERIKLTNPQRPFRISFEVKLDNGFELKDMTQKHIQEFHNFLRDTVYKGLTNSQVDKLFLRKKGLSDAPPTISHGKELIHYGKSGNPFRIFGYYNQDGYFVICRVDGAHQTNK